MSASKKGKIERLDMWLDERVGHHKLLHDNHIRISGKAEDPAFTDSSGRAITAHQPHAPPVSRAP